MRYFILVLLFVGGNVFGQTVQLVEVVNTNAVSVVVSDVPSAAVASSFGLGWGFGLTVCGFGWVLRMARRVVSPDNS